MRIGIGLPAAIPGADATGLGAWAEESERLGFHSLAVIDRLVYDNLDPLVALAAAAARTERIELQTTVLNVPYRRNPVVLAKQLASLDLVSAGRLTAGLAIGGWPEDHAASDMPRKRKGAAFDAMIATMRRVWAGELSGAGGPMPALDDGRPQILLGGLVPASFARAAAVAKGWIAPAFGLDTLAEGAASARRAWADAGRSDRPRIVTIRYFCLGEDADAITDEYLAHYYGAEFLPLARPDALTTPEQLRAALPQLAEAGCDDVALLPCSSALDQVELLAEALDDAGIAGWRGAARRWRTPAR